MTDSCCGPSEAEKNLKEDVQEYYGKTLTQSDDLQTNACCTGDIYPDYVKEVMKLIHDEVHQKYYGCGLTIPHDLKGRKVLDLGSGAGRDCFILSKLVGDEGEVVGVDMTKEQLDVANKHIDYHTKAFGLNKANTKFLEGQIEKLDELNLEDNYFDTIVSNCVINLCGDKKGVLGQAYRVLKEGGELYFSDVYSDRRISKELREDKVLWGECLSGALYWNDFINLSKEVGFKDPRMVEVERITINNPELEKKCEGINFYSVTYRLFKLPNLEPACEDYGQSVTYKGSLETSPEKFMLDSHHIMNKNEEFKVCSNSFDMLKKSRFEKHFEFKGDTKNHLGIFKECGESGPFSEAEIGKGSCC